jgi:hypothetical protein
MYTKTHYLIVILLFLPSIGFTEPSDSSKLFSLSDDLVGVWGNPHYYNWWVIYPDRAVNYGSDESGRVCKKGVSVPTKDNRLVITTHEKLEASSQEEVILKIKENKLVMVGVKTGREALHDRVPRESVCMGPDGYLIGAPFQKNIIESKWKLINMHNAAGDYSLSLHLLKQLASKGEPDAMHVIGQMYAKGQGVDKSLVEAEKWFVRAASITTKDFDEEMLALGVQFYLGDRVEQNYDKAKAWFLRSSQLGNAMAAYSLWLYNMEVTRNYSVAMKWLKLAADRDHIISQIALGKLYGYGKSEIIKRDTAKGRLWCQRALNNKDINKQERVKALNCLQSISLYEEQHKND